MAKLRSYLLVIFLTLGLLELSLRILPLIYGYDLTGQRNTNSKTTAVILGESTSASNVFSPKHSWPMVLQQKLNEGKFDIYLKNLSQPGSTSTLQIQKFMEVLPETKPKLLITMLGINDLGVTSFNAEFFQSKDGTISNLKIVRLLRAWLNRFDHQEDIMSAQSIDDVLSKDDILWLKKFISRTSPIDENTIKEIEERLSSLSTKQRAFGYELLAHKFLLNPDRVEKEIRLLLNLLEKSFRLDPSRIATLKRILDARVAIGESCDQNIEEIIRVLGNPRNLSILESAILCTSGEKLSQFIQKNYPEIEIDGLAKGAVLNRNYQTILDVVIKNSMCWIVLQYPMRTLPMNLSKLDKYESSGRVFFLENRQNFQEQIRRAGWRSVFEDRFGGDFGHTTEFGTELIADSVFQIIQKNAKLQECLRN